MGFDIGKAFAEMSVRAFRTAWSYLMAFAIVFSLFFGLGSAVEAGDIRQWTDRDESLDTVPVSESGAPRMPAYGDAYHEAARAEAVRVPVSITKDFNPVGFKTASRWNPYSDRLSPEPTANLRAEPPYRGTGQLYGALTLGVEPRKTFAYVFDLVNDSHPLLYFDTNANSDLSDDGGPIHTQGAGVFAAPVRIPMATLNPYLDPDVEFTLWFFTNDSHWEKGYSAHYSMTQLEGSVTVNGRKYKAYIAETGINDADFTNDGIRIDLDGDGKTDSRTETVLPGKTIEIDGVAYWFDVRW